jgi:hypothetical protein
VKLERADMNVNTATGLTGGLTGGFTAPRGNTADGTAFARDGPFARLLPGTLPHYYRQNCIRAA